MEAGEITQGLLHQVAFFAYIPIPATYPELTTLAALDGAMFDECKRRHLEKLQLGVVFLGAIQPALTSNNSTALSHKYGIS
jgi:hypothetical protein